MTDQRKCRACGRKLTVHEFEWRQGQDEFCGTRIYGNASALAQAENQCNMRVVRCLGAELSALRLEVAAWRALAEWCEEHPRERSLGCNHYGKGVSGAPAFFKVWAEWNDDCAGVGSGGDYPAAAVALARELKLVPADNDPSQMLKDGDPADD